MKKFLVAALFTMVLASPAFGATRHHHHHHYKHIHHHHHV
jgi:hypothetical protein